MTDILNEAEGIEFPPVYDDIGAFLADTEKIVAEVDPTQQDYLLRMDKRQIIKSQTEYQKCVERGVQVKVVPYSYACHILKEQEARHRNKIKARRKNKLAKASRKKNR